MVGYRIAMQGGEAICSEERRCRYVLDRIVPEGCCFHNVLYDKSSVFRPGNIISSLASIGAKCCSQRMVITGQRFCKRSSSAAACCSLSHTAGFTISTSL